MSRPKLFIVVAYLGHGGTERQTVEFVRAAHPKHADVTVVCLAEEGANADEVRATGARVEVLGIRRPRYHKGIAKLVRLLRDERPDAVYALLFHQYCVAMPAARAILPSAARVAGRRSMPEYDISPLPGAARLRKVADRFTDVVIANSNAVRAGWLVENPKLEGRIEVVPNGIRVPDVEPAEPEPGGRVRIVCVANLIDYKGHRVLVEALAGFGGRDDWRAHFVGEGPERAAIEQQLRAAGIADRVTLHGAQPSAAVHALVKSSDIAVLPSFTEGLPNAVLEAMAHGVPVVASDVGGVPDLLGSGAGIVVSPGDARALAEGIGTLLDDPTRRAAAGAEGLTQVRARYTVQAMRDSTLAAIGAAMNGRNR
jgi:glycosyltransferase involved in cell wall biosynthesis